MELTNNQILINMKKSLMLIAALAVMFCACEKDPQGSGSGNNGPKEDPELTGVEIDEMVSATVKAGIPASITIKGGEFDEMTDHIWLGWNDADTLALEEISTQALEIRKSRITFGIHCYSASKEKTVNVYLKRDGFKMMKISGDIKVTTPTIEEGFIPDQQFYADLTIKNPSVIAMTGSCGLIDVAQAKALKREPNPGEDWPFDISWALSGDWRGLELFESLGSDYMDYENEQTEGMNFVAWFSQAIEELDCSNWVAPVKMRLNTCKALKKFVCGPNMFGAVLDDCESLEYVDMHLSNRATWLYTSNCPIKYLDIRHCQKGEEGVDYWPNCESGSIQLGRMIQPDALIKIDSYYLIRHYVPNAWERIYDAWKAGATIEVYSCIEIDEKLGTVPAYADDPDALSPTSWDFIEGEDFGYTTNGWRIDDPHTERDEAAVRPTA